MKTFNKLHFLIFLIFPISINGQDWEQLNVSVSIENLFDVFFLDESNGWATGTFGQTIRTINGGLDWVVLNNEKETTRKLPFFISEMIGWSVVSPIRLQKTTDGGLSWTDQYFAPDSIYLIQDVHFLDELEGFLLVHENGTTDSYFSIQRTLNGGDSWSEVHSSNYAFTNQIHFFNGTGWMIGEKGLLVRSVDGGATWEEFYLDVSFDLIDIQFIDELNGRIIAYNDVEEQTWLLKTSNGGIDWTYDMAIDYSTPIQFKYWDGENALMLVYSSNNLESLYSTDNDGESWNLIELTEPLNYKRFFSVNKDHTWLVGECGRIIFFENYGLTSEVQNTPFDFLGFAEISIINSEEVWAIGPYDLAHTIDGGETWDLIPLQEGENFRSIMFVDSNTGWIGGSKLYKTTDGGETWVYKNAPSISRQLYFLNDLEGWICGAANGVFYKTEDGAESWITYEFSGFGAAVDFHFITEDIGWVLFTNGVIRTLNGGLSWESSNSFNTSNLIRIDFVNAMEGFIFSTDESPRLYHTIDGGETWNFTEIMGVEDVLSMDFLNPNKGWISTKKGEILYTENGGQDWTMDFNQTDKPIGGLAMQNTAKGWATGGCGMILEYEGTVNSIDENRFQENLVRIFPNPTEGVLNYQIPDGLNVLLLNLIDINGNEVLSITHPKGSQVDISNLSSGIYYLELVYGNFTSLGVVLKL